MRDLQAARRAPLNPTTPADADGPAGEAPAGQVGDVGASGVVSDAPELSGVAPAGTLGEPGDAHAPDTGDTGAAVEHRVRLWPLFASVALVGLAADVVTKVKAVSALEPGVPEPLVGRLLTLRLIRNPGAAFSQGEGFTWVFTVAAVLVLGFVLVRLVPRLGHVGWTVALGLLVAGVSGNLADRLFRAPGPFRGHVVDFLQLPHWPIFNVADMCITTAAVMVVVLSLLKNVGIDGRHPGKEQGTGTATRDAATPA